MSSVQMKGVLLHVLPLVLLLTTSIVPPAEAVSSRQLVETTDFSSPVVSPDGRLVAFRTTKASIERNTYDSDWFVQAMDGSSPPRRVADGGVPLRDSAGITLPAGAIWSADGRWIYYRALVDGRIDVWRAAADGSGAGPVTRDRADVWDFSLSPDGSMLRYSVGAKREAVAAAEQAEYDRGIRLDRKTPIGQNLFRSGYIEGRPATQRLGLMFNRVFLDAELPENWTTIDLATGERSTAVPSDVSGGPPTPSDLAGEMPDVWKVAREPGTDRIVLLTRTGERAERPTVEMFAMSGERPRVHRKCIDELCTRAEISGVQWRPGSDEVVFTTTKYSDGFAQSIFRWNVVTNTVLPVAASSGMFAGEGRWGPGTCGVSSSALACVTAEANRPPRLERIDLETGERQTMFDPNEALARDLAEIPAKLLRWTDSAGRMFTGQFYPANQTADAPSPLFVTYYRCMGFVRGGSGDEWPLAVLSQRGVSTLCINAPSFSAVAEERYGVGRSSIESAVALLASEGVDTRRIGIGGLSFGSEVTMWMLIHSNLITAASMASPSTSQMYALLGSNIGDEFDSLLRENWQLGRAGETPEAWQQISPASNLHRIRAPILMQFPEQEYMHGIDYIIPLARDDRADVYVFPHEPHNKFQPRHKHAVYERNLDWFLFWLLGIESVDPQKADQHVHWQTMRARQCQSLLTESGTPWYCDRSR